MRKMWFREYKVWCVSVRKRTHIHCIFPASDENTKKLLYVLQMVIFIIILRERLLSWKVLLNITIFLYFHHLRGKLTVNMCTLSYRDTPDFVLSEPHFPPKLVGRSVWYKVYADVLSIYVNSRWLFWLFLTRCRSEKFRLPVTLKIPFGITL